MKKKTLADLYLNYPDKKYIEGTIPRPYFPKTECTNNKYSLNYKQWSEIVYCYFFYVKEFLFSGNIFTIPNMLGTLQFKKYRSNSKINWKETKLQEKRIYFKNLKTSGYTAVLKWKKNKQGFSTAGFWRVRPNATFKKEWFNHFQDNPNTLLNFSE